MDTEIVGNKKFISLKLNAKYKSKFADYFGKKGNSDVNIGNKIIKNNRTTKYLDKYDKFINFTNLKKKYRAYSNKIILPQKLDKNIIEEKSE